MQERNFKIFMTLFLGILVVALSFQPGTPVNAGGESRKTLTPTGKPPITLTTTPTPTPTVTPTITVPFDPPSVVLTIAPATVQAGESFTLNFTYHNLGIPYTYIHINPPELIDFDPSKIDPCRFEADPTHCTAITLKAKAKGTVSFSVDVSGEIYDSTCSCWRWGSASAGGSLVITNPPNPTSTPTPTWPVFLPFMRQ